MIFSITSTGTVGAVVVRERSRSLASAARVSSEVNTVDPTGRNLLVSSGLRNISGLDASSGGVIRRDARSAASTTMPTIASRSSVLANRYCMVWRAASAVRFHLRHVARFSPTASTTLRPSESITLSGMSSARNSKGAVFAVMVLAQRVASSPRRCDARSRHCPVSSARDRTCLSGLVESVAFARNRTITAGDGRRPCSVTYWAMRRSVSASM